MSGANHHAPERYCRRLWRRFIQAMACVMISISAFAQNDAPQKAVPPPVGVQMIVNGGERELRIDGVPYFVHAAQFDYFRIPPDLWRRSLEHYRDLGINTIDLPIPWNWHEPSDGQFDFDGHTNPRRNLRGLLQQIAQTRMKLIVRPGPLIGDNWRNSGYPPWLLSYSDYKMSAAKIQQGMPPPEAQLATRDANAAAHAWLANEIHMSYARRWLTTIARELAPYSSNKLISIKEPGNREGEVLDKRISGPILFVALDDASALRPGEEAPDLARYVAELRRALMRGGLDTISFLNTSNAADAAVTSVATPHANDFSPALALAGQWILRLPASRATNGPSVLKAASGAPGFLLSTSDAWPLILLSHSLGTQESFPPFLSSFTATAFAPANDSQATQSAPENMLLASRLFLANGIRALSYSPLQDTLTPAGWEIPSTARYLRADAPLDLATNRGVRANSILRNGQFISLWGAMLAGSHRRADFGILDLRASSAETTDAANAQHARMTEQLFRAASLAGYAPELVNPAAQSVERLLRDRLIILSVPEDGPNPFRLSDRAQAALLDFVKRGGTLAYFPRRPQGALLEPLFNLFNLSSAAPESSHPEDKFITRPYVQGHVTAGTIDHYSWGALDGSADENPPTEQISSAAVFLSALLDGVGAHRSLIRSDGREPNKNLFTSQLVVNESMNSSNQGQRCVEGQLCAAALLGFTNLSPDQAAIESFEFLEPHASTGNPGPQKISFDITVPARESLMLPVHAPLCSAVSPGERCSDEVVIAGAELLGAERDGKTLELTFYAPSRAVVRLHLEGEPSKVELDENVRLDTDWKQESGELQLHMPRGAAPFYRRVLRIHLRYMPHVVEKVDPEKKLPRNSDYEVFDGIRFPLGAGVTIPSGPPLIAADANSGGHMTIVSLNHSDNMRLADFTLDGAFHGSTTARIEGEEELFTRLRFQPFRNQSAAEDSAVTPADGLLHGTLSIKSGREHGTFPVAYVTADEAGNSHYEYDFDRDGSPEWTLESSRLRLIVSPADHGRALALVDKLTNDDLITLGGALQDFLLPAESAPQGATTTGDFAFNRAYHAEWIEDKQDTRLRLTYQEYEKSPAGIHVEKTVHFASPESIETAYRISLVAPVLEQAAAHSESKQTFISMLSVPIPAAEVGNARFCWSTADSSTLEPAHLPAKSASPSHCEELVSAGLPISVPEGVARMEIDSPGRHSLIVEWTQGRAVIVPQTFSAQVNFLVPLPSSLEAPGEFTLRYTVGSGQ